MAGKRCAQARTDARLTPDTSHLRLPLFNTTLCAPCSPCPPCEIFFRQPAILLVYSYIMSSPIRTRALEVNDRAAWQQLWDGYLEFYRQSLPREITEFTWSRLVDPSETLSGIVAVDAKDRLLGFAHQHIHLSTWSTKGYCYLEDLYVEPSARGSGVGRALIEAVYRWADERGATRVYWHTEETNEQARRLYDRIGKLAPFVQYRRE